MKVKAYLFAVYALLLAMGGFIGWLKASSMMSLYAGVGSGALLLISSHFIYRSSKLAFIFSLWVTIMLTSFFSLRFAKTGNFMPGGLMALLGLLLLVFISMKKEERALQKPQD